jgi:hypothetical protein
MMEIVNITYIVRMILPDGKNKTIVEEEYNAASYYHDQNNNLVLVDANNNVVIDIHNYNYVSIKPK